jgi:hypothetical protein
MYLTQCAIFASRGALATLDGFFPHAEAAKTVTPPSGL